MYVKIGKSMDFFLFLASLMIDDKNRHRSRSANSMECYVHFEIWKNVV